MHRPLQTGRLLLALLLIVCAPPVPAAFDDTAVAHFDYPDWFKTTFLDLRDDLADARAAGKRGILLFFSTAGCSYCKQMLDGSFQDPAFAGRVRAHYDVIGLEIFSDSEITDWSGDRRTLSEFARQQGVQFTPTLVFLDLDGRRLLRLVGYYETAYLERALDYLDNQPGSQTALRQRLDDRGRSASPTAANAALVPDTLFADPPHQLDRSRHPAQRPLLVLFDGIGCLACTRFHRQVLAEPEIREALQAFDVVRLDTDDDRARLVAPDGSVKTAATWHREMGFSRRPALAVFDENGRQLLTTDAVVQRGRFAALLSYVSTRAYEKGWTFQRHARNQRIGQ